MATTYERSATTVIRSRMPGARVETARLRVDDEGLWLDDALAARHEDISSVSLVLGERTTVRVERSDEDYDSFPFTTEADAAEFALALGRAFDQTAFEVALEPSMLRAGFLRLPLWKTLGLILFGLLMLLLTPIFLRPLHRAPRLSGIFDRRLEVGADGLRIRGRLADEFLPYEAIAGVDARGDAMLVRLENGEPIPLPLETSGRLGDVVARVRRAIDTAKAERQSDHEMVALLAGTAQRGITALREMGGQSSRLASAAAYRRAEVPRERLLRLAEHPMADGASRVRAAIALSESLTDAERERLRIAADVTVSPKVRVALAAATLANRAALEETLAEVDASPRERRVLRVRS